MPVQNLIRVEMAPRVHLQAQELIIAHVLQDL
jgi:hypothetical protein